MLLSKRLQAVADAVTVGNRVADIGCDHAYISIYLGKYHIAPSIIAADVNKGPLGRAKENIIQYGLEGMIETRLSNGLDKIVPEEVDTILLSGMGGTLMIRILEEGKEVVKTSKEVILQPQSEIGLVREYFHRIGFVILEEKMLIEEDKYYVVLKARMDEVVSIYEKPVFYRYGKILLEKQDGILKRYLIKELKEKQKVMTELEQWNSEHATMRKEEILLDLRYIEEALTYYV